MKFRHRITGRVIRVVEIVGSRIKVLDIETGNREWIDNRELEASYKRLPSPATVTGRIA